VKVWHAATARVMRRQRKSLQRAWAQVRGEELPSLRERVVLFITEIGYSFEYREITGTLIVY
jgi:hypothetical protein